MITFSLSMRIAIFQEGNFVDYLEVMLRGVGLKQISKY